ncbi:MAG: LiaF transmembrane domain-containing protein [Bacilli bacterium]
MNNIKNILWGIILVIIGVIIGLNTMGITNIDIFFDGWWTLVIIVPCFIGLFTNKDKTGNIIGLLVGVILLLGMQNIIDFNLIWKLLLPSIIVIIGLSLIFKNTFNSKINNEIKKLNNKNTKNNEYCATFSGQRIDFPNEEFKGATLNSVFGSITCDLREAKIKEDVVINASSVFGGIDIIVPDDVNIKIKSNSIFGGVNNKKKNNEDKKYTIYVNASCLFGGVDIK